MAGGGVDPILVDRGLGFVWWAVCESTHPLSCHSTGGSSHGEPHFYPGPGG
jgi:hypothetical protein